MLYPNLRAEMARKEITNTQMAKGLGVSPSVISKMFRIPDALKVTTALRIRDEFFPECTVSYLFSMEEKAVQANG